MNAPHQINNILINVMFITNSTNVLQAENKGYIRQITLFHFFSQTFRFRQILRAADLPIHGVPLCNIFAYFPGRPGKGHLKPTN
jgi:hypothetical protein